MKKIAVLVHSLTIEYTLSVLNGVTSYCKNKDIKLVIGQVRSPHSNSGIFDFQYWSNANYLFSDEIEAAIIISGSFSSSEEIKKELQTHFQKPIVSIGLDYQLSNSYYIHAECNTSYNDVVSHLKEKHGCRKFAFMTARNVNSKESEERFNAFKMALEKNDLEYNEDRVFHASFTSSTAITSLKERIKSKEDVNFDVILAANDLMALGCLTYLQEIGIAIPQDVKVIGFDETSHAANTSPKLSTMDQLIFEQGYLASETACKLINNESVEHELTVSTKPIFRQSCGCVPLARMDDIYMDLTGMFCRKRNNNKDSNFIVTDVDFNMISSINKLYTLFDMFTSATTLSDFSYKLPHILNITNIDSILVSFYDKPIHLSREDDFVLPEKLNISMYTELHSNKIIFEPGESFNPHQILYPEQYFKDKSGTFFIQPIFSGEMNYGFIICKANGLNYALYSLEMMVLSNAMAQAWEYTRTIKGYDDLEYQNQLLQQNNSTLSIQSQTDELTGILNRRGFMTLGQQKIDMAIKNKLSGLVLFADMDGLKKINDTYGHDIGDKAIKAISSLFPSTLRSNDISGRLSGDEFAAVAVGLTPSALARIRSNIDSLCKKLQTEENFAFDLSISMGYAIFDENKSNLTELLKSADQQLYNEKKIKHSR